MKFGLSESQYKFVLNTIVKPLNEQGGQVWCFGSRARGDFQRYSDLDLMVLSERDLSAQISNIRETLEKSNFPYKVDLVTYQEFAPSYRESFERDKILMKS